MKREILTDRIGKSPVCFGVFHVSVFVFVLDLYKTFAFKMVKENKAHIRFLENQNKDEEDLLVVLDKRWRKLSQKDIQNFL